MLTHIQQLNRTRQFKGAYYIRIGKDIYLAGTPVKVDNNPPLCEDYTAPMNQLRKPIKEIKDND